jgi:hypothetical protein
VARPAPTSGSETPAIGPDPVATHGSAGITPLLRPHTHVDPGDPRRHAAVFSAAALDRSRSCTGQSATFVTRCAETELIWPLRARGQGPGNSASTLGQLCVNSAASVPGAVRATGAALVRIFPTDRRSRTKRCGVRVIGVRATLRQLLVNSAATLRQFCGKGRMRPSRRRSRATPRRKTPVFTMSTTLQPWSTLARHAQ